MSDATLIEVDPFNPTALDEETELRALARALEYSEGFKLIFIRCNQPQQRERLADELQKRLPQLNIQKIHFGEPVTHLLDALRERLDTPTQDAVFVSGIEYSLPVAAEAHATSFVANLNASRNSFPQVVNRPLVLWLPEYALNAITIGAPDFFSIRSGIYFFAATLDEAIVAARELMSGDPSWMADLTLAEKQERIAAVQSLLADYEAFPPRHGNKRVKALLNSQMGRLFFSLGDYQQAQRHYQRTLELAEELQDSSLEGIAVSHLGDIYELQGQIARAEESYQRSLMIFNKNGEQANAGTSLGNLGNVYLQQGKLKKGEEFLNRSLLIFQEKKDRVREGQTFIGLGHTCLQQGKLKEAEEYYRRALDITIEVGKPTTKATSLGNLGNVYMIQGRMTEAEESYLQALAISRELGEPSEEAVSLNNLGALSLQRGLLSQAEKFFQESLAIRRRINDRAGEESVLQNLAVVAKQMSEDK